MHSHSPTSTSRLSLSHLLRDPATQITLAPTPSPATSPYAHTPHGYHNGGGVGGPSSSPPYRSPHPYTHPHPHPHPHAQHEAPISDTRTGAPGASSLHTHPTATQPSTKPASTPSRRRQSKNANAAARARNDAACVDPSLLAMNQHAGPSSSSAGGTGSNSNADWGFPPSAYNGVPPGKRRRESESGSMEPADADDDRPLAITCAPCRARKIKCDSKKPACANCSKNPADCFYPVKLKPGLRPGTGIDMVKRIEQLEDRVAMYESRLADQDQRIALVQVQSQSQSQSQSQAFPTPIPKPPSTFATTPSTGPSMPLPMLGGMSFDMPPPVNPPSGGPLDLPSFGPSASPSGISVHSFTDPRVLPPDDIVRDLIGLFFQHIHPWAPIISPTLSMSPPWNITVHALVVLTLRYSTDPRLVMTKEQYRQAAKQHVLAHAIESTSLSSVQALALLALDLVGSEQGPSSWGILALLTRSAVHLGLAREEETNQPGLVGRAPAPSLSRTSIIPPPANWHEDETRRRLFWLIFCLDRYACVSTGWDFALPDFEIKRRLPCSDDVWNGQDWYYTPLFRPVLHRDVPPEATMLSPTAYLVEALDLLGRAHTLQSQTIEPGDLRAIDVRKDMTMTLTSAARRWFSERNWSEGGETSIGLMIQAIHHATLLKLNAYYAFPALSNGEPQEPFTSTCMASARATVALTEAARGIGWRNAATPFFVWGCWVAARVLFVHAFLEHQLGPDSEFESILRALKEMTPFWALANQYTKLLERAKRKWLASMTDPSPSSAGLPDAIHVLLDLRRTAYSAVNVNQTDETPHVSPPDVNLSHLPAWAVQPLLGDLHSWFDLPAGLFQADV